MHLQDLGLGRLPAVDPKDQDYLMGTVLAPEPPRVTTWYFNAPRALNQGPHPHCVGFSWKHWLMSAPLMTKTGPAPATIYHAAQRIDEWPGEGYDGTSVRAGIKVLQDLGYVQTYLWAFDAATIRDWILAKRGTVVVGTVWYSKMFFPDPKTGFVEVAGNIVGGHAYVVVGYSSKRKAFRCLNSWGYTWGDFGRFWILETDLDRLIRQHGGEACTAVEQKLVIPGAV